MNKVINEKDSKNGSNKSKEIKKVKKEEMVTKVIRILKKLFVKEDDYGEERLDKNKVILVLACSVMLMFLGRTDMKRIISGDDTSYVTSSSPLTENMQSDNYHYDNYDYKKTEEERIKNFVLAYDGVEDAKVLLSVKSGKEKILAYDVEKDSSISRSLSDENSSDTSKGNVNKSESIRQEVIRTSQDNPYILMENEPVAGGIIILVKGNVGTKVITNIRESMKAYLDLPLSNIKVYQMQNK